jgi:hypothetical protein
MGKASSSKKVARAAKAGGGAGAAKRSTAWMWPVAVLVIVGLGALLIFTSRQEREATANEPPTFGDHWHAAYAVNICGRELAPLRDQRGDRFGIHTHDDGLIHIHPRSSAATGERASLQVFFDEVGLEVTPDELSVPGRDTLRSGEDDCDGEPGVVQVKVWDGPGDTEGRLLEDDIASHRPDDGSIITFAFLPEGADIPQPSLAANLQDPTAAERGEVPPVTFPDEDRDDIERDADGSAVETQEGDADDPDATETTEPPVAPEGEPTDPTGTP